MSQGGAVLLGETMRATGQGRGLSAGLARWRAPRAVHDPGKIIGDLAAAVALGGDCLADITVLREQPQLAGPGTASRWRSCCGTGEPGPTPPPATSRSPASRSPSYPGTCAAGSWSAPTPAAARTGSLSGRPLSLSFNLLPGRWRVRGAWHVGFAWE